jgi:hypothetical protein
MPVCCVLRGAVLRLSVFFRLLFDKSADFKTKFPTINSQASVMSKVIGICLSIDFERLSLQTMMLQDLGKKHVYLVQDPWQYSIYATTSAFSSFPCCTCYRQVGEVRTEVCVRRRFVCVCAVHSVFG